MGTFIIAGIIFIALACALYRIFSNRGKNCGGCNGCGGCCHGSGQSRPCGRHREQDRDRG